MRIAGASRRGRKTWLPVATVLLVGALGGNGVSPGETARVLSAHRADKARAVAIGVQDRETILSIVREHRRRANENWLNTLADVIYQESVEAAVDPLLVASIFAHQSANS